MTKLCCFRKLSLILQLLEIVYSANITNIKCDSNTENEFPSECFNYIRSNRSLKAKSKQFSLDSLVDFSNSDYLDNGINPSGLSQLEQDSPLPLPTQILDELFGRRLFNSTMCYIVPMFHVSLPFHTDNGSTVHLAMQAFLGLFSALAWIATIAIPTLLTGLRPFGLKKSFKDEEINKNPDESFFLKLNFNFKPLFDDQISEKVGLDWDTCIRKTVCQAYESPKKYGLLAVPFLVLYPSDNWRKRDPKPKSSNNATKENISNSFHTFESDCGTRYHCFFDVLDLMTYLANIMHFNLE